MEGTGEISDTDSGIILHSGSDSPTTHAKDVTTHTRAMKIKHQALQDQLERCLLELKTLCIREAELTGKLPKDYPLLLGEKPPQIRKRIGAAYKLEEQNIPERSEDSELCLVDAELALQMKIYEAARKLCEEEHRSKTVRKSLSQQCKVEEKKVKKLQEKAFQLRLERGRSSPLPAFNITQDLGTSDDSSLSDSVVQDEEVASQSSQPSLGFPYPVEADPPQPPLLSAHSSVDDSYMSPSVARRSPLLNSCQSPCPSLDSKSSLNSSPAYDPPPIQHSPWAESSLDQPYQKSKKSRSSSKTSPTTHAKDVTTHTRAMKIKHQALQDQLERCLLELKTLCIREAELTGKLPKDYPLLLGEKPPQIRKRIGAAYKLEEQNIPERSEDSELCLVDAELALQMKIYEAARKLCEEEHRSKTVRKSLSQQCKVEEKKVKKLQEKAFQLRLERGRSSPLPAFNITQDLGTSDDSSLSDSVVQDEEVASQSSQPSLGFPYPVEADPPQPPLLSAHSSVDDSYMSPSVARRSPLLNSCQSPCPSLDSKSSLNSSPAYDPPPIQHSPWAESSLDQPYQKSKKSRSSSKTSTTSKSELLPPLEVCLLQASLPQQLSHLRLSRSQSNSMPSTPEMRVHRQLSLRLSNPESSVHKDRGRPRGARRRLTEYGITLPDAQSPTLSFVNPSNSEDSSSEKSFSSYSSSPRQEFPSHLPRQYQSGFPVASPEGSYGPQAVLSTSFHPNPRHMFSPGAQRTYYNEEMVYPPDIDMARSRFSQQTPSRYEYCYRDAAVPHQRAQRPLPPDIRVSPPAQMDHPHYRSNALPRQVVNEQLKSWHRRSQFKAPRSRSLDRQGAIRMKSASVRESTHGQNQKYHDQGIQRGTFQRAADDTQQPWLIDDGTHYISQV